MPVREISSTLGRPDVKIVDTARAVRAGLIVMGAYGRNRISEYFLGSNAAAVVRTSPVAVLLARDVTGAAELRLAELAAELGGREIEGDARRSRVAASRRWTAGRAISASCARALRRAARELAHRRRDRAAGRRRAAGGRRSARPHPSLDFARAVALLVPRAAPRARRARARLRRAERAASTRAPRSAPRCVRRRARAAWAPARILHANVTCSTTTCASAPTACSTPAACSRERTRARRSRRCSSPACVIGGDGFGYVFDERASSRRCRSSARRGRGRRRDRRELDDRPRARSATTRIGRGTKIDNLVQVAHNVEIGAHVGARGAGRHRGQHRARRARVLMAQAGVAGSPRRSATAPSSGPRRRARETSAAARAC